jgi:hypothetical protein
MRERTGFGATQTITRPADTTAYAAGDVVGGLLTFSPMGIYDREVLLTSSRLLIFDTALIASEAAYRLHLYEATPPSAFADNAAWDLPANDRAAYRGYIDLGTPVDLGSSLFVQVNNIQHQMRLMQGTTIFAYLQTLAGYVPSASRQYRVSLRSTAL